MYFVSSNPHSLVNLVTTSAGASEDEIVDFVESNGPDYLTEELERFRTGRTEGSWENFLYYGARLYYEAQPEDGPAWQRRRAHERELGVKHLSSRTGLRVSAQVDGAGQARPGGAGLAARADRRREARARPRRDRQHRVPARPRRLQHPARDHDRARHAARRLRARQGGDAERRRRRRADLRRHPRRALGLDLLARQRVLLRRHRAVPGLRLAGSTTSAR